MPGSKAGVETSLLSNPNISTLKCNYFLKGAYWIIQRFLVHYKILHLSFASYKVVFAIAFKRVKERQLLLSQ